MAKVAEGSDGKRKLRETAEKLAEDKKQGVLVVANDGELYAFFNALEEALEWLRNLYSKGVLRNSLIKPLGRREIRYLEISE